ncbi:hypothetical protein EXIGLDRAFT_702737 [Exidia glandulosa HHB12029]|uniref:Uncharacterized protein n=1 Tax=Exidia glandulosa HHB12029 TaxID=1314781 RepID=A0A165ZFU5_EXIGL|nr:hypothetical protein EXIGLDRAFT_702737 [Exidia glandulosa HHB12029]
MPAADELEKDGRRLRVWRSSYEIERNLRGSPFDDLTELLRLAVPVGTPRQPTLRSDKRKLAELGCRIIAPTICPRSSTSAVLFTIVFGSSQKARNESRASAQVRMDLAPGGEAFASLERGRNIEDGDEIAERAEAFCDKLALR